MTPSTLVCVGFMGAGKSTAARSAADSLGLESVDIDEVIEARRGRSIPEIFETEGEAAFRAVEEEVTLEVLGRGSPAVVSLGGGALGSERIRAALAPHRVVWLDVDVQTAWERAHSSGRPLARDRARFEGLYAEREPVYASAADAIVPARCSDRIGPILRALDGLPPQCRLVWAASESAEYPAFIGPGLLEPGRFWPAGVDGRRFLITDGHVGRLFGDAFEPLSGRVAIMPGEQSKTIAHAEIVWTELMKAGLTRADLVVALGGGVVGDLAGFCAATYQRGVRYVQVPTTLVAQVDSAYGGKTGVDLAEAKNYVGAYHEPSAVIGDTAALSSLPAEEVGAGYAEVVKTALLAGGWLWERVRGGADPTDPALVTACVLTKLRIVGRDERDAGLRQILNFGHTVGHAIETVTGYARYRHGEAVALGLLAALRLSGQPDLREEVRELLAAKGLPTSLDGEDPHEIVLATERDKKRLGDRPVPFVLLDAPGAARAGCEIEGPELAAALRELSR